MLSNIFIDITYIWRFKKKINLLGGNDISFGFLWYQVIIYFLISMWRILLLSMVIPNLNGQNSKDVLQAFLFTNINNFK